MAQPWVRSKGHMKMLCQLCNVNPAQAWEMPSAALLRHMREEHEDRYGRVSVREGARPVFMAPGRLTGWLILEDGDALVFLFEDYTFDVATLRAAEFEFGPE